MIWHRTPDPARRRLFTAAAIATALAIAGCASQDTFKVCTAGGTTYLCPERLECGGARAMCLVAACGNGERDVGEQCDDGNISAGDGCSPTCRLEVCGNGVFDPGEVCDDGNTASGDGCSADCRSQERCGNGMVDVGEACDDGNTTGGDGCSADCRSTEVCGNSILDREAGEVCDDGNTASGDGCGGDCRSTEQCNNGELDDGEECDHGLFGPDNPTGNADQNDCRADCMINRCGDGYVDLQPGLHREDCDGAPPAPGDTRPTPTETAICNLDCTFAACGDGKINRAAGEECDDGAANGTPSGACTLGCRHAFCGDGIVNDGEACDRAKTPATCNLDCTISACGDNKVNHAAGEQCDDANQIGGDGCSPACLFEHCGNGVVDPPEECDGAAGAQPCSAACQQERCGNAILDDDDATGVHEQCDDGNLVNGDGCSHDCEFEFCGDGIVNDGEPCDRAKTPATCNLDCTISACGDGKVNPAGNEQCDDGNAVGGDGCSPTCTFE